MTIRHFCLDDLVNDYGLFECAGRSYVAPYEEIDAVRSGEQRVFGDFYAVLRTYGVSEGVGVDSLNAVQVIREGSREKVTARYFGYANVEVYRFLIGSECPL